MWHIFHWKKTTVVVEGEANDVVDIKNSNVDNDLEKNDSFDESNSFSVCDVAGWLIDLSLWFLIYCCRYWRIPLGILDRFWSWGSSKSVDCQQCGQYISCWRPKLCRIKDLLINEKQKIEYILLKNKKTNFKCIP